MAFFKTKQEKEIIARMEREEQLQVFTDQINELKSKRTEYAKVAAEAEINGDTATYDIAVNAILELSDVITSLTQTKANFDIINISNSVAVNMATAMNALDKMANGKAKMPNLRKIQRAQVKLTKYMRQIKISQKAMSSTMKSTNPANRVRSSEDLASVRPFIEAERAKIAPKVNVGVDNFSGINLADEIEKEKNKIF